MKVPGHLRREDRVLGFIMSSGSWPRVVPGVSWAFLSVCSGARTSSGIGSGILSLETFA